MSTILRALKKLEQDRRVMTPKSGHRSPTYDTRRIFGKSSRWGHLLRPLGVRWSWPVIALSGLTVGVWLAGVHISRQPVQGDPAPVIEANPLPDAGMGAHLDPKRGFSTAGAPKAIEHQPALPVAVAADLPLKAQHPPSGPIERSVNKKVEAEAAVNPPDGEPVSPAPAEETGRAPLPSGSLPFAPPGAQPAAAIPRLIHKHLDVQAIVWSPVIEERMAVINSHVVHQGNSVDGFTVVSIEEDGVVVQENGQRYIAPFGSR